MRHSSSLRVPGPGRPRCLAGAVSPERRAGRHAIHLWTTRRGTATRRADSGSRASFGPREATSVPTCGSASGDVVHRWSRGPGAMSVVGGRLDVRRSSAGGRAAGRRERTDGRPHGLHRKARPAHRRG
ncbi:hypothetical protein CZ771_09970 [Actinomycetales bacterium JB111]|nr:hypothetical protein CZ771_09970 [Actinomycetales bacterium JB111]